MALADLVNRDNAWMLEAGSSFRLPAKSLHVQFCRPSSQTNYFERNGAIEAFLPRPINYALTTPANFLQQLVVAEFGWHLCGAHRFLQKWRYRGIKKT